MLVKRDIHALAAKVSFAFRIGFVRFDLDDAVVVHVDFQTAVLRAQNTAGFMQDTHICSFRPECNRML